MKTHTRELLKTEFITIIKDYPNFPFHDRIAQEEVAEHVLEQVFDRTNVYVTTQEKKVLLREFLDTVVFGLRQIQKLQDDPEIEEIMINGLDTIFVKKRFSDGVERVNVSFASRHEVRSVIEKLLEGTGRRIDRSSPIVDTRLADGSRVNIVIEPLALGGPYITIRKFPDRPITADDLLRHGTISPEMYTFLGAIVKARKNVVISGSTAAGKTTTLSALLDFVEGGDFGDRVVLIEQIAEIKLPDRIKNRVQLETRPPNIEGNGEYSIQDLLKNALRQRPDRIIIGEIRGGEAFDLLQALNTGHDGSFTTLHANSCTDALMRLESMVLMSGMEQLPLSVIRTWIRRSVDFVIQQKRMDDGYRKMVEIAAVDKSGSLDSGHIATIPIFTYENGRFQKDADAYKRYLAILTNPR
ncbi:MAG: CpaF family protein [Patescibacteria group bacterium]|nr:CpaF family protein [Patescibacteria group bacterium]